MLAKYEKLCAEVESYQNRLTSLNNDEAQQLLSLIQEVNEMKSQITDRHKEQLEEVKATLKFLSDWVNSKDQEMQSLSSRKQGERVEEQLELIESLTALYYVLSPAKSFAQKEVSRRKPGQDNEIRTNSNQVKDGEESELNLSILTKETKNVINPSKLRNTLVNMIPTSITSHFDKKTITEPASTEQTSTPMFKNQTDKLVALGRKVATNVNQNAAKIKATKERIDWKRKAYFRKILT